MTDIPEQSINGPISYHDNGDGSTTPDVWVKGTDANNPTSVPFTTTSAAAVGATDASNSAWVSVQQTSTGTNSTTTFQTSNDNTNWQTLNLVASSSGTSASSGTLTANGLSHGPLAGKYFRLNITGISAGTTAGTIVFFPSPKAMQALGVNAAQSGNWQLAKQNTASNTPSLDSSFGSVVSHVAKASGGNVFAVSVSSVDTSLVYLQLHNKATALAGGDVPIYSFAVAAGTATVPSMLERGEEYFGSTGRNFATGITWGISTTNGTYTAASTAANYNVHLHFI